MTLFETLFVAHILGDWLFQTEWMAENKNKKISAMIVHLIIYHIFILAALRWKIGFEDLSIYFVLLIMIAVHTLLDLRWTVETLIKALRINVKREPDKWLNIAIDQALHIILLAVVSVYYSI